MTWWDVDVTPPADHIRAVERAYAKWERRGPVSFTALATRVGVDPATLRRVFLARARREQQQVRRFVVWQVRQWTGQPDRAVRAALRTLGPWRVRRAR